MTFETITFAFSRGVGTISFNRPERLNAFNDQMLLETTAVLTQIEEDPAVRCVLLTGNGRAFSAGQDLKAIDNSATQLSLSTHLRETYHRLILKMVSLKKPIIGAINGVAAGAGCGVALATDLRIMADTAGFMLAFSKIGLIPDSGTNWFLPRLVGYARAYEMAVTADLVTAEQALTWGMVNRVVPAEQLHETAVAWAHKLAAGPTLAFGLTKQAMMEAWSTDLATALEHEGVLQDVAGNSQDRIEGIAAFLEKRSANFQGK